MNDEAVALLGQRIKELNLPQPITAKQAIGKTLSRVDDIGLSPYGFIEFSDNTVLFMKAEYEYEEDCDLVILGWPQSVDCYLYWYLELCQPEAAKRLAEEIRAIEDKSQAVEQERYDRDTYERLKAKFEGEKS
jgi:hypothetical protein